MPFECYFNTKLYVSHLREFGASVWILLQGQQVLLKMEARSKHQALVGYDDGSKSVLYYNAETCKILISRNFRFLEPSIASPECLLIMPDDEGELRDATDIITGTPDESSGRPLNPLKH